VNRLYGLIGNPLEHSWSKQFFDRKFIDEGVDDAEYRQFQLNEVNEIFALQESLPQLCGLNVTIPYKTSVISLLDVVDPVAKEVNAVNTIAIQRSQNQTRLHGYNTDVVGFETSIKQLLQPHHRVAMILGTGGAALATAWVFKKMQMDVVFVSRNPVGDQQISYDDVDENLLKKFTVIVNATPLGMYPETGNFPPLPYQHINSSHLLFDMVYNPMETQFLLKGRRQNAATKNGLEMLHLQAEKSWEIWTGQTLI
jgi:shikimate dehydrogenase